MKKTATILILIFFAAIIFSNVSGAMAASTFEEPTWTGIVPCGTGSDACTICDFIVGIQRIVQYGLYLSVTVAFLGIFFAGFMYIISSGDTKMMEQAKGFLKAALIGFTVVLGGWMIVNITLNILSVNYGNIDKTNWYTFECTSTSSDADDDDDDDVDDTDDDTDTESNGTGTDGDCTTITSESICKLGVGCKWNNNKCEIDSATGKCGLTSSEKASYSSGVICCVTTNKFDCSGSNVCKYASISLNQGCSDVCGSEYSTKIDDSNCKNKLGY